VTTSLNSGYIAAVANSLRFLVLSTAKLANTTRPHKPEKYGHYIPDRIQADQSDSVSDICSHGSLATVVRLSSIFLIATASEVLVTNANSWSVIP